jgi:hypothetical protein
MLADRHLTTQAARVCTLTVHHQRHVSAMHGSKQLMTVVYQH